MEIRINSVKEQSKRWKSDGEKTEKNLESHTAKGAVSVQSQFVTVTKVTVKSNAICIPIAVPLVFISDPCNIGLVLQRKHYISCHENPVMSLI